MAYQDVYDWKSIFNFQIDLKKLYEDIYFHKLRYIDFIRFEFRLPPGFNQLFKHLRKVGIPFSIKITVRQLKSDGLIQKIYYDEDADKFFKKYPQCCQDVISYIKDNFDELFKKSKMSKNPKFNKFIKKKINEFFKYDVFEGEEAPYPFFLGEYGKREIQYSERAPSYWKDNEETGFTEFPFPAPDSRDDRYFGGPIKSP